MNNENKPEAVILKGQANLNLGLEQSLTDLKVITNGNKNLSTLQKNFFVKEIGKVQTELKNTKNINEIIQRANEINLQIQLIQAKKAIESGFLTEEVNKNLKEAESTIKDLKKVIKNEKLEKSLDEISNKVFWESLKLRGVSWLTSLNESIKEWKVVNNINKDLNDKINEIVQKAQTEYISKELTKLEQERKNLIELGDNEFFGIHNPKTSSKLHFTYGNSLEDPPVVLIEEKMYKLKHIFEEKQLTDTERAKQESNQLKIMYEKIEKMEESKEKAIAMKEYWNKLTSEMESAYNKGRKWEHVKRDKMYEGREKRTIGMPPEPYYAEEYNKYIAPNSKEIQKAINYQNILAKVLLEQREKFDMDKNKNYLKDEETGLYWYAGMPSPISFDDYEEMQYAAHEGSRYLGSEGPEYYYRLHAGQDIGRTMKGYDIKGVAVRSVINGTYLRGDEFLVEQGDGYAIRYRHMPLGSYSQFKTGDKISTNEVVGAVGNHKTIPYHLHYEILKGNPVYEIVNGVRKQKINKTTNIPEYIYDIVLDPSKIEIKGGKIYEKK